MEISIENYVVRELQYSSKNLFFGITSQKHKSQTNQEDIGSKHSIDIHSILSNVWLFDFYETLSGDRNPFQLDVSGDRNPFQLDLAAQEHLK